ncbi:MAG TPA: Crp/Fnr family transcriptional regulator [Candidatus Limnocylindrales bacterium]
MLTPRPSIQVLAALRLFEEIDRADLTVLSVAMGLRRYRAGEVIFHQGDPGDALHVIVSGAVKRILPSTNGDEAILATLRRQAFFGELALLDNGSQSTTAVALEPTETVSVPRATFMELIATHACARAVLLATLATELRRLTSRVEALYFLDVPGRVADVLVGLSLEHGRPLEAAESTPAGAVRIDGRLTQGDLAAMVNSSRQSVNQALAELGGEGIVRFERDGIVILSPDRLAARARL